MCPAESNFIANGAVRAAQRQGKRDGTPGQRHHSSIPGRGQPGFKYARIGQAAFGLQRIHGLLSALPAFAGFSVAAVLLQQNQGIGVFGFMLRRDQRGQPIQMGLIGSVQLIEKRVLQTHAAASVFRGLVQSG